MTHRENDNDSCVSFRLAMDEAEKMLAETDEQFRQLETERARLQAVIASLSAYLEGHSSDVASGSEAAKDNEATAVVPNFKSVKAWEQARAVLEERKLPMAVPEIYEAMLTRGINIAKDAIRVAMLRKPQIFRQAGNATYALMEWTAPENSGWKLTLGQSALRHEEAS